MVDRESLWLYMVKRWEGINERYPGAIPWDWNATGFKEKFLEPFRC